MSEYKWLLLGGILTALVFFILLYLRFKIDGSYKSCYYRIDHQGPTDVIFNDGKVLEINSGTSRLIGRYEKISFNAYRYVEISERFSFGFSPTMMGLKINDDDRRRLGMLSPEIGVEYIRYFPVGMWIEN